MSFSCGVCTSENGGAGKNIAKTHHAGSGLEKDAKSVPSDSSLWSHQTYNRSASVLDAPRSDIRKIAGDFGVNGNAGSEVIGKSPADADISAREETVLDKN
jgi:hypothetical protein